MLRTFLLWACCGSLPSSDLAFHFKLFLDTLSLWAKWWLSWHSLSYCRKCIPGGHQIRLVVLHWARFWTSLITSYDCLGMIGIWKSFIYCRLNARAAQFHCLNTHVTISSNSILMGHLQLWLYDLSIQCGKMWHVFRRISEEDRLDSKFYSMPFKITDKFAC